MAKIKRNIQNTTYKIRSFTDLNVWKEGHELVILIYKVTKKFPKDERFGLVDQLRRAAISITSNIAEGFSRQGKKEKIQFYFMAKGSISEVQNQLLVARDVHHIDNKEFNKLSEHTIVVHKLLNGLIKSAVSR
jgi:four helix bundle protein